MDDHGRMEEQERLIEAGARPAPPAARGASLRRMQTKELVAEAGRKASLLVKKEIELAKAELRADVRLLHHPERIGAHPSMGHKVATAVLTLLATSLAKRVIEQKVLPARR